MNQGPRNDTICHGAYDAPWHIEDLHIPVPFRKVLEILEITIYKSKKYAKVVPDGLAIMCLKTGSELFQIDCHTYCHSSPDYKCAKKKDGCMKLIRRPCMRSRSHPCIV